MFLPIFVGDAKIICGYNSVAPLNSLQTGRLKDLRNYVLRIIFFSASDLLYFQTKCLLYKIIIRCKLYDAVVISLQFIVIMFMHYSVRSLDCSIYNVYICSIHNLYIVYFYIQFTHYSVRSLFCSIRLTTVCIFCLFFRNASFSFFCSVF